MPNSLKKKLLEKIFKNGSITLDTFMEIVLFDKDFGYYNTNKIIGYNGDFITSPEISQVFGELIFICIFQQWEKIGKPKDFSIIDLGPGKGTLMKDLLYKSKLYKDFFVGLKPILYEKSNILRNSQKQLLKNYKCHWIDEISDFPKIPSFIIANEFFDSLPIKQFVSSNGKWYNHSIFYEKGKFFFGKGAQIKIKSDRPSEDGMILEIGFESQKIFTKLVNFVVKNGSSILIIDYGQLKENLILGNTLQAIRNHQTADIFKNLGQTDISSWVNFTLFKKISVSRLNSFGPIPQKKFLYNLGIKERFELIAKNKPPEIRRKLLYDFERLVSDNHMGQAFKVFGLSEKRLTNFPGF